MPAGLRRHVRYPEGIFNLQAAVYSTYHMTNPAVFYNKEDQWEVPTIDRGARAGADGAVLHDHAAARREATPSSSRCCRSRRGAATTSRRGWWRAATATSTASCSSSSSRSRSWCSVRARWSARINQDQVIAPQITLWNQQGSEVIQGTLMVIPIEESLLYIRPLYLRAQAGPHPRAHPRHRRLQGSDRDGAHARGRAGADFRRVHRRPHGPVLLNWRTRRACCTGRPRQPHRRTWRTQRTRRTCALAAEARAAYERALAAQKAGDWAKYGEEIRRLGEILSRMK